MNRFFSSLCGAALLAASGVPLHAIDLSGLIINNLEDLRLSGPVRSVVEESYLMKKGFGKWMKDESSSKTVYAFDPTGNMTEEIRYYADGSIN